MKLKIILAALLLFSLVGCAPTADTGNGTDADTNTKTETETEKETDMTYKSIGVEEAKKLMESESGYIILDVRHPDEYASGHIPLAVNVPNENIGEGEIPELPEKDQMILVYCRSGRRSKEASEKLVRLGYTNIIEFGGIIDWTGEIEK